jgi:SAM-dependent methyltransferase
MHNSPPAADRSRSARASLPVTWEEVCPVYAEIVGRACASGGQVGAGAVRSATVANETTATPSHGEFLIRLMRDLGELDLRGRRVLEVGCGFGTVAAYVVWRTGSVRMLATDLASQRIREAREGARRTGLDAVVEYSVVNASFLGDIEDERFDAVIAVGVLMYLERPQQKQALRELHRVLALGRAPARLPAQPLAQDRATDGAPVDSSSATPTRSPPAGRGDAAAQELGLAGRASPARTPRRGPSCTGARVQSAGVQRPRVRAAVRAVLRGGGGAQANLSRVIGGGTGSRPRTCPSRPASIPSLRTRGTYR